MTWLHAPRGTWAGRARPPLGRRPACMPLGCAPGAPALLSPLCGVARVRQRGAERRRGFRRRAPRRRCMSRTAAPGSTTPATRTPSSPWCTATPTSASGSRVRLSPAQEGCARPPQYWSSVLRCPHLHSEVAATHPSPVISTHVRRRPGSLHVSSPHALTVKRRSLGCARGVRQPARAPERWDISARWPQAAARRGVIVCAAPRSCTASSRSASADLTHQA